MIGFIIRTILRLLSRLEVRTRARIGACAGYVFSLVPTRDRKIAELQMNVFLGSRAGGSISKVYSGLGQTVMECINLEPILERSDDFVEYSNFYELRSKVEEGGGVLALTAHLSNWDLLAAYIIRNGVPLTTVGREARNKVFHDILVSIRDGYGIRTIWKSDKLGIQKLISDLKDKRLVAALIDQDTDVSSKFIQFFGRPAKTPSRIVLLAQELGATIMTIFMVRTSLCRYKVFAAPIDPSLSCLEVLTEYHRRLETIIRGYPSQWVWFHKRWRTTSDGERMPSRSYVEHLKSLQCSRNSNQPHSTVEPVSSK